jgi:predicted P-loop ATPase
VNEFDDSILATARELSSLGFSLHWLHQRQKRPIGKDWSERGFQTFEALRNTHTGGTNIGVRLGEPSRLADDRYLHVIDADIRVASLADEAMEKLRELLPVDPDTLPMVRSGSGGASFHLYFVTDKPFRSKRLAVSEGKHRDSEGRWHYDWELELFGTGKQVVLPPSIHPSGKPYVWEREFDSFAVEFDDAYRISSDDLARLAVAEHDHFDYEDVPALTFKSGQIERIFADIESSRIDDYHDWVLLGQAIHHQFGGSDEGFEIWDRLSQQSEKYSSRGMRRKYASFGKYRGRPVTMATISQWAQEARLAALADDFDDLEDLDDEEAETAGRSDLHSVGGDFAHLFDDESDDAGGDAGDSVGGESDDPFDAPEPVKPDPAIKWQSLLDVNEEGAIKGTLHNIALIVENDPRSKGIIRYNAFADKLVQHTTPGTLTRRKKAAKPTIQLEGEIWRVRDPMNGDPWIDTKDALLRRMIEAPKTQGGYGIKVSDRDLVAAIEICAARNSFHPVQDYLKSLTWDGQPRIDNLFIEYLKTPNNAYYRTVARLSLIGAVTRVFEPGHKFDFCAILEGLQGRRKSTFIKVLGRDWSAELDGDFADDRAMIEKMQGAWILEIPELSGFTKAEVNHIKAFMTRQEDRARMAYARRVSIFQRQCIFMGSTNDRKYLKDETGGRRFWPVECTLGPDEEIDTDRLAENVDQIWAEAYQAYLAMRAEQPFGTLPLYIRDRDAAKIALALQESRRVESMTDNLRGMIEEWLNKPHYTGDIADGDAQVRTQTCAVEIWVECFGGDPKKFPYPESVNINKAMRSLEGWQEVGQRRFKKYGRQKGYERVSG